MQPPSNTGGSIPLQEYRRDVPPGWTPGDPSYPLRSYFEKMRLWYRVSNVEDESVGPLLAGRLYGRAAKVAMTLKVPRPDGRFDTGDAALARLSVEEVQDPTTGAIIQHAIPSGVQFLVDALRRAFGQQDQDLATEALEKFFSLTRGKLSLAEYAVEFDTRLDEAADRAGLQLNDVAKFFLWFKHSGMSVKVIDDIKLQVGGDYTRFQDARALALRMSPNRSDATNDPTVFYGDVKDESYGDSYVYHQDTWDQEQDMWYGYEDAEEGEWIYETDENYFQDWSEDPDGWQSFYEDGEDWTAEEPWSVSQDYEKPSASDASPVDAATEQESFYKGKGKPKDGCFNCGSKWHQVRDCPMKSEKGKGYAYQSKGKYGKGKGFRGRWTWRPSSWKGKGKGKSKYGFRGGYKGKGKKGHWFVAEPLSERTLNVQDGNIHVLGNTPRLDQNHGPPHESFVIHSSSEDDIMKVRRPYVAAVNAEATSSEEPASTSTSRQPKTLDTTTWNFMFLAGEACSYFQVRGQERKGLLIDPGAASGLVGSETLRMLLKDCAVGEPQFEYDKKTPVSGISGTSSSTLGQVTVPLRVGSLPITYTAEVLGGEGSLCPALVGNPTLRKLNATIFANWFDNGDGLMTMDGRQDEGIVNIKFFRLLLTESGHYILPTDDKEKHKTHYLDKNKAILFCQKAALATAKRYEDLHPRVHHCFLGRTLPQARAEGDRCENEKENEADKKDMTKHMALHAVQERPCPHQEEDNEQKMQDSHHAAQEPHDAAQPLAQAVREENDKVHHSQDHNAAGLPILDSQPQTADDQYHTCKQIHEEGNPMPADLTPSAILANSTTTDDRYVQDVLPAEHDHLDVLKLNKRYKAIPEEYYSKSGLTPVTPGNFKAWFSKTRGRGLRWHAWELCSGSGRLSLCLLMAGLGLVVGFPVDYRYGWDINNAQHQSYLDMAYHEFQPGMVHASPDCAPWSISSNSRDPELRHQDRLRDRPGLHWLRGVFEKQDKQNRGYNLEQPQTSAMWQEHLPENPMKLSFIKGNRKRQRVDQCMHGACDECRNPIKKSTGFGSNIRWNRCALRCSGHRGQAHSHLQGTGPDGLSRTSSAAVYPQTLCQRMKNDIIGYLTRKDLLDIGKWPDDCYHTVITHMYECIRCQLGRGCPKSIEHTLIPGQCRHGKWPPGESPKEKAKADADPLLRWKTEVSKEILDTVEIRNISSYGGFSVEDMHFLKKLLMEVVHSALGIFDEAVQQKKEYLHWITDPVHMSLFKEIFGGMLVVKGVKISLRPFTDGTAEPHLPMISSYLRLHVYGTVKDWKIMPLHDLREMSHSQIHQAIDIDDWLITIYGVETAAVPAPSTPASRPRAIPPEAPLPPKAESLSLPRLMDRPLNEKEEVAIIEPVYEDAELATQSHQEIAPLKPNYNLRKVLERLPKAVKEGDIARAKQLLLGLHERLWHSPMSDFLNLLRRSGMPTEVTQLVPEVVNSCTICRKYVRLPNRPQYKTTGVRSFGDAVQIDLFKFEERWFLLMIDEATRYKVADVVEGHESEILLAAMVRMWFHYFGPPQKLIMDQQQSLMGHSTAAEFERMNVERCPRGTTAGPGAEQHTGTGLVERHVSLIKMTMLKLRAELQRQGLNPEPGELARESAMAHNLTLSYGGVTPAMNVFGVPPRPFYEVESSGLLSAAGALETDLSVFERAMRIRQTALAQSRQAVIEDRIARANKARPHQLDMTQFVPGTSEVEFYREVKGDVGWRGPALLLRLDSDEGVAVIQYQGKPYLVSLRHIRAYRGLFLVDVSDAGKEESLRKIMKYTESLSSYKPILHGWVTDKMNRWIRLPKDNATAIKVMQWATDAYSMLDRADCHGCILGKALRHLQPPRGTIGHLITWIHGGVNYAIQEHNSDNNMIMKKITNYAREDICIMYLYRYAPKSSEDLERSPQKTTTSSPQPMQVTSTPQEQEDSEDMEVEHHGEKRDGPDSRTVTFAPERKRQKLMLVKKDLEFLRHYFIATNKDRLVQLDFPENWKTDYNLMMNTTRKFLVKQYDERRRNLPELFHLEYKQNHFAYANLRTGEIYKVDQETNNIEDEDITPAIWKELNEADHNEVKQFVDEKAFKKIHKSQVTNDMVEIDCRWVRKYKRYPDKSIRIKSRLCARGCLDAQKTQLTTRSTTATRLSQRILVSHAARCRKRTLESLDIAGAFLKGFNFDEIRKTLMKRGMNAPERTVIVYPPANVWRRLKELDPSFAVPHDDYTQYGLLCCKPIYGLNDAPLAWQFCLRDFIAAQGATCSHLDENCWTWKENNEPVAMLTTHVDDLAISATPQFMNNLYDKFVGKFKKVTRQQLPFDHCGCEYSQTADGYFIGQKEFAKRMKPAPVPDRGDDSPLTPPEVSDLRSILGALLWITATRLDVIADVSLLQSRVTKAEVQDLKNANEVLKKVTEYADMGLHYRYFKHKAKRLAVIHDASAANKGRSYAQEGVIVCLTDDAWHDEKVDYEHTCNSPEDDAKHGGVMHVLYSHGAKSKRISYSTSHGETLAMVNALEASTLCMIRLSEIMRAAKKPSLQQLIEIQSQGNSCLPMDMYCDARDVFELVTGTKTLPQDKTQRLYILAIKEARLDGRVRMIVLIPTQCMLADSLTKSLEHDSMYFLLSTGLVKMYGVENHPIVARVLPTARDFSENDLHKEDKELYDKFGAQAEASFASFLLGLICKNKMTMFALMMASAAQAQKPEESNSSEISDDMWSIYFLILYTVMVAVGVQLVMNWMFKKREKTAPRVAVKKESSDDDMMEVDFEMSKNRKRKSEHSGTEDVEKLQAKINGYEDLVEKLNRLNENNKTSADDWYRRYQDAKDNMDSLRAERDDARNDRDQQRAMLRQQYEKEQDLRDQLNNTEIQLQTEKERLDGMKKAYDLVTKREHDLEKKLQETERDLRMSRMAPSLPAPKTPQSVVEEKKMPDKIFTTVSGGRFHLEGCHHLNSSSKALTKCHNCCT